MGVVLLAAILVSGFIYCHRHPLYFYKLHRYEGQYLYLQAAKLGLVNLVVAYLYQVLLLYLLSLPCKLVPNCLCFGPDYIATLSTWLESHQLSLDGNSKSLAWLISLGIWAVFIIPELNSRLFEYWHRCKWGLAATEDLRLWIMETLFKDSPLESLLYSAFESETTLMITMADRKVYVGRVASMGEPNENEGADQEIAFVPIVSGYREKDTLKVNLTTQYDKINATTQCIIILKQENIISASEFNFEIWEQFQKLAPTHQEQLNRESINQDKRSTTNLSY